MEALKKKARLKGWDRRGVSEILANILILGITVTLFSTVIAFVSTVPEPDDPVQVEMEAFLDGDILSITHKGGSKLPEDSDITRIRIEANGITGLVDLSFGTTSNGDQWEGPWSVGRTWFFNFTANAIGVFLVNDDPFEPSTVKVGVSYLNQGNIIWSSTLKTDDDRPPRITSLRVEGASSSGTTLERLDTVTIRVTVKDSDGDMGTVFGNLDALFKDPKGPIGFNQTGTNIWQTVIVPTADNGTRTISINATDLNGNADREFFQLRIVSQAQMPDPTDPQPPPPPSPPPPPFDPEVPGGNPTESPQFLDVDVPEDFYIFRLADWTSYVTVINQGDMPENLTETKRFNQGQWMAVVFKVSLPANYPSGQLKDADGTIRFFDPLIRTHNPNPYLTVSNIVFEEVGSLPSPTNPSDTYYYLEAFIQVTSEMEQKGARLNAEVTFGSGNNLREYRGGGMINPVNDPIITTSSLNQGFSPTLYFKKSETMFIFNITNIEGAGLTWRTEQQGWRWSDDGLRVYNIEGQHVSLNTAVQLFQKDLNVNYFQLGISKSSISSLNLVDGWNALFFVGATANLSPGGNYMQFAHKFYVEV